jgi:hypothetical protein
LTPLIVRACATQFEFDPTDTARLDLNLQGRTARIGRTATASVSGRDPEPVSNLRLIRSAGYLDAVIPKVLSSLCPAPDLVQLAVALQELDCADLARLQPREVPCLPGQRRECRPQRCGQ